jgi:hypothetical protein
MLKNEEVIYERKSILPLTFCACKCTLKAFFVTISYCSHVTNEFVAATREEKEEK